MQLSRFSGYCRILTVQNPIPMGKMNSKGEPLYKLVSTLSTSYGDNYDQETNRFAKDTRAVTVTFTNLTVKAANVLQPRAELCIDNGIVYDFKTNIAFLAQNANALAGKPADNTKHVSALEIIDHLANVLGEEHRENLKQIIPPVRTKIGIEIPAGNWEIVAHPAQIEAGQSYSGTIEIPIS
jgi:hypothetical protein